MNEFVSYFENEQEFYLEDISFKRLDNSEDNSEDVGEYALYCKDDLSVFRNNNIVKVKISRNLKCIPEALFELTVSFGATLKLNDKGLTKEWTEDDLKKEFCKNGQFVTSNLMNRISLLIAEITSSFGQTPMVIEPKIMNKIE